MAHQGLPHVLQNTRFHQASVERVAKIMKAEVANARPANGCLPTCFDPVDRTALEGEDQAFRFFERVEEDRKSRGERDLAGLPTGRLRVSNKEQTAVEVDMLPTLR